MFCELCLILNGNGIFVCVKYRFLKIKLSRLCFMVDFVFLKQYLCRFFSYVSVVVKRIQTP